MIKVCMVLAAISFGTTAFASQCEKEVAAVAVKKCNESYQDCMEDGVPQFKGTTNTGKDKYLVGASTDTFQETYVVYTKPGTCEVIPPVIMIDHE